MVVPDLLAGHEIDLILPNPGRPDDVIDAFWALPPGAPPSGASPMGAIIGALASPPDVPGRPATPADLALVAPEQAHWPPGTAERLLAVLNRHISVFEPLDMVNKPLRYPTQRMETTTERGYNKGRHNTFDRFSEQYASFMSSLHGLVRSGHFTWIDATGHTLVPLPGDLGPSATRAALPPGTSAPKLPWVHSAVLAPKGIDEACLALDLRGARPQGHRRGVPSTRPAQSQRAHSGRLAARHALVQRRAQLPRRCTPLLEY